MKILPKYTEYILVEISQEESKEYLQLVETTHKEVVSYIENSFKGVFTIPNGGRREKGVNACKVLIRVKEGSKFGKSKSLWVPEKSVSEIVDKIIAGTEEKSVQDKYKNVYGIK